MIIARTIFLSALLLLTGNALALTVDLPAKTFSGLVAQSVNPQAAIGGCPSGEEVVAVIFLDKQGNRWAYWWQPDTRRIVFALWIADGEFPDALGFGITDAEKTDEIPPLDWKPPTRELMAEGPCGYLVGPKKTEA